MSLQWKYKEKSAGGKAANFGVTHASLYSERFLVSILVVGNFADTAFYFFTLIWFE
jgi:hypothetical protein